MNNKQPQPQPQQIPGQSEALSNLSEKVGLTIIPDAIDQQYHDELIRAIDQHEWDMTLKRRTIHFGYLYNYKSRNLTPAPPLPEWALALCQNLINKGLIRAIPQQLIINEYFTRQGISKHIDSKIFGNTIFSISLGAACTMIFKKDNVVLDIQILPRAFLKMEGECRSAWTHEIDGKSIRGRRISLTFRYVGDDE